MCPLSSSTAPRSGGRRRWSSPSFWRSSDRTAEASQRGARFQTFWDLIWKSLTLLLVAEALRTPESRGIMLDQRRRDHACFIHDSEFSARVGIQIHEGERRHGFSSWRSDQFDTRLVGDRRKRE